jgi:hypothetical protein
MSSFSSRNSTASTSASASATSSWSRHSIYQETEPFKEDFSVEEFMKELVLKDKKSKLNVSKLPDFQVLKNICETGANESLLKDILNKPENTNILLETDEEGWTPLMIASFNNKEEIVKALIDLQTTPILGNPRLKIDVHQKNLSGATAYDLARSYVIGEILFKEEYRKRRLNEGTIKTGYHETSLESFGFIVADNEINRYPMVGGTGGYFGGGIYFALSKEDSSRKALYKGYGFECELKMGTVYMVDSIESLKEFLILFCDKYNEYTTPTDVMKMRLLEKGYDSVWGHHRRDLVDSGKSILKTGDEIVIYSADQIQIKQKFVVFTHDYLFKGLKWEPIQSLKKSPVKPTRKAKFFKLDIIPKDSDHIDGLFNIKEHFTPYYPNDTLENGDLVYIGNEKNPINHVNLFIYIKNTDYACLTPYSYMPEVKITNEILFLKRDNTKRIFLCFSSIYIETLGFNSNEELYDHYWDLIQEFKNKGAIRILVELKDNTRDTTSIEIWKSLFPMYFTEDSKKYYNYREKLGLGLGIYGGYQTIYFIKTYPNYFISKPFTVTDLKQPFGENRSIQTLISSVRFSNETQRKIAKQISGEYRYDTCVVYIDFWIDIYNKRYTFKEFLNEEKMKLNFCTFELLEKTENRWVIGGDTTDMDSFRDYLQYENIHFPLFVSPNSTGSHYKNIRIKPIADTNRIPSIFYEFIVVFYKDHFGKIDKNYYIKTTDDIRMYALLNQLFPKCQRKYPDTFITNRESLFKIAINNTFAKTIITDDELNEMFSNFEKEKLDLSSAIFFDCQNNELLKQCENNIKKFLNEYPISILDRKMKPHIFS